MEPKANEFPKCLVLNGGGHVHIRHITPSSLVDVGCYNPPSLGARRPRRYTCTTRQSGYAWLIRYGGPLPVWLLYVDFGRIVSL